MALETETQAITKPSHGAIEEEEGRQFGPYKTLHRLGRGGMGAVYLAEQQEPIRRLVALKMIKPGMDTREVMARFDSERQALALMDHPNIARVFDAGSGTDGRPYFVMEHVPGIPITEYCDQNCLTNRERLELMLPVCRAVQHAHQKGIIHRDIKPSNVLVSVQDGRPVPKVIDFGVAKAVNQKLIEKTLFTEHGVLIGTPEYMSPEQADANGADVDTTTDIYSLGTLLYELLVGALPFDPKDLRKAGYDEMRRIIREEETPQPTARLDSLGTQVNDIATRHRTTPEGLRKQLRGELNWITARAMEKERSRRYASASELAADIERHLRDEPVTASPPGAAYRLSKFLKKRRGTVAGTLSTCLILVVSLGLAVVVDGVGEINRQFESTLERADSLKAVASSMVLQSLNRQLTRPVREALRDPELHSLLVEALTAGDAILEVAVVDPHNEILLDTDTNLLGLAQPPYKPFRPVGVSSSWREKLWLLLRRGSRDYYQLEQELGISNKPLLKLRVIIDPALIREKIKPTLRQLTVATLPLVILTICIIFLLAVSVLGFRQ
jgi:serine/threonine protein kinase